MKCVLQSVGIFAAITLLNSIAVAQSPRDMFAGEWKLDWLKSADLCKDQKWEKRFREATSSGYEAIYGVHSEGIIEAQSITPEWTKKKRLKWRAVKEHAGSLELQVENDKGVIGTVRVSFLDDDLMKWESTGSVLIFRRMKK